MVNVTRKNFSREMRQMPKGPLTGSFCSVWNERLSAIWAKADGQIATLGYTRKRRVNPARPYPTMVKPTVLLRSARSRVVENSCCSQELVAKGACKLHVEEEGHGLRGDNAVRVARREGDVLEVSVVAMAEGGLGATNRAWWRRRECVIQRGLNSSVVKLKLHRHHT